MMPIKTIALIVVIVIIGYALWSMTSGDEGNGNGVVSQAVEYSSVKADVRAGVNPLDVMGRVVPEIHFRENGNYKLEYGIYDKQGIGQKQTWNTETVAITETGNGMFIVKYWMDIDIGGHSANYIPTRYLKIINIDTGTSEIHDLNFTPS